MSVFAMRLLGTILVFFSPLYLQMPAYNRNSTNYVKKENGLSFEIMLAFLYAPNAFPYSVVTSD